METNQTTPMASPGVDPFLSKWNWGAFLLSWIWAFGHGLAMWGVIALVVSFIPGVGGVAALGIAIYLGIKGNELAWQTGKYASIEVLKETEQKWTKWAIILFCVGMVLVVVSMIAIFVLVGVSATTSTTTQYFMFL